MRPANLSLALATAAIMAVAIASPAISQDAKAVAAPAAAPALPGGASSLSEQYGGWTVSCSIGQGGKQCSFAQSLSNSQTGKVGLSLQLRPQAGGKVGGILLTPLGQRLDAGVKFTLDDKAFQGPLPFLACVDSGCLVEVNFDPTALAALKAGTTLKLSSVSIGNGQPQVYSISLAGFSGAVSRTIDLLK